MRARHHGVPGRGALGEDLHLVAPKEDLDDRDVDERERHQLVADRLSRLFETRLGGNVVKALGEGRPHPCLEHHLRLRVAEQGDVADHDDIPSQTFACALRWGPADFEPAGRAVSALPLDLPQPGRGRNARLFERGEGVGSGERERKRPGWTADDVVKRETGPGQEHGVDIGHEARRIGDDDPVETLLDDGDEALAFAGSSLYFGDVAPGRKEAVVEAGDLDAERPTSAGTSEP